jgi:hypothetical protein
MTFIGGDISLIRKRRRNGFFIKLGTEKTPFIAGKVYLKYGVIRLDFFYNIVSEKQQYKPNAGLVYTYGGGHPEIIHRQHASENKRIYNVSCCI